MADDDLVRLEWRDTDETEIAEGRRHDGHHVLPRGRAEGLIRWVHAEYGGRFELTTSPWRPATSAPPTEEYRMFTAAFWLAIAEAVLGFLGTHLWAIFALLTVVSMVLAIYLPTDHLRVYPALGVFLFSALLGATVASKLKL